MPWAGLGVAAGASPLDLRPPLLLLVAHQLLVLQAPRVAALQRFLHLALLGRVLLDRLHRLPGVVQDLLQLGQRILDVVPAPPQAGGSGRQAGGQQKISKAAE